MLLEAFIPYLAIQTFGIIQNFGTVMQSVTASEWIILKWKAANITNHDLQRALRDSYSDALNSINFAFRQKTGFLNKLGRNRLNQEITASFNDQFLNPFVAEKQLNVEEIRSLATNCTVYCNVLQSSVDAILPLTEISNISIEDLLMTGRNLQGADDIYRLNSEAGLVLMEKIHRVEGIPDLFCELLAYKGLFLGSIVFFFNERIKSDERVRSILLHSELQRIREEQNRQHHQEVALLEQALHAQADRFNTCLSPIRDNFSEVVSILNRMEAEITRHTQYLESIYDMLCHDRGLSEKERRQLQAGLSTTFSLHDKYDFDESKPIGYGSVAVVYKAVHKGLKQERALKLLKPEHKENPEIVERFLREGTVLGDLSHQNIIRIYDAGGGGPDLNFYLEMEYIDGITLRKSIESEVFNWDRVFKLIGQLGSAIQKMHGAGIIHRDLNPRNIMVDKNGSLKVMDFGVAKIIGIEGFTRDGQIVGTHDYMAPEQARGQRVDERADIYSFGMIVYELCTKRIPAVPPLPMRQYQLGVPEWFEEVVVKCLAQDKVDRYSSMKEALVTIDNKPVKGTTVSAICTYHPHKEAGGICYKCRNNICGDCSSEILGQQYCPICAELMEKERSPTKAPAIKESKWQSHINGSEQVREIPGKPIASSITTITPRKSFFRRYRLIIGTMVLVIAISIPLITFLTKGDKTFLATESSTISPLADKPSNASKIAYVDDTFRYEATPVSALYVMDNDGSNQVLLAQNPKVSPRPVWSPDGNKIAFYSDSTSGIDIVDKDGKNRKAIAGGHDPTWSPDNSMIAFASGGISVVNLVSREQREIARVGSSPYGDRQPAWSPDGEKIAFISQNGDYREINVVNVDGSSMQKLVSERVPGQYGWDGPLWSPDSTKIAFVFWTGQDQAIKERAELQLIRIDDSGRIKLAEAMASGGLSWSPDGTKLAFMSNGSSSGICTINTDGSNFKSLAVGGYDPTWSPDGRWITFAANGIYVIDSDGNNKKRVTTSESWRQYHPVWSPR